ncbi:hypothetical protein [Caudoviricetes sp.]|nr:hypothetical protein [Caudoviricetes sp.]
MIETKEINNKSIQDMLVDRIGKINETECYTSNRVLLLMFKNGYSITVEFKKSRKFAIVNVYKGIGNITPIYFPNNTNKRVIESIFMSLAESLESKSNEDISI